MCNTVYMHMNIEKYSVFYDWNQVFLFCWLYNVYLLSVKHCQFTGKSKSLTNTQGLNTEASGVLLCSHACVSKHILESDQFDKPLTSPPLSDSFKHSSWKAARLSSPSLWHKVHRYVVSAALCVLIYFDALTTYHFGLDSKTKKVVTVTVVRKKKKKSLIT